MIWEFSLQHFFQREGLGAVRGRLLPVLVLLSSGCNIGRFCCGVRVQQLGYARDGWLAKCFLHSGILRSRGLLDRQNLIAHLADRGIKKPEPDPKLFGGGTFLVVFGAVHRFGSNLHTR